MRDKQRTNKQTNKQTLKIELLSQWKLEAEFRNCLFIKTARALLLHCNNVLEVGHVQFL